MKRIESPSKRWPGYVILHDPLTLEMVFTIEDAQDKATELEPSKFLQKIGESGVTIGTTWSSRSDALLIPTFEKCVSEWHLEGFPDKPNVDNFPASPRRDVRLLIDWLWEEINKIYTGETEVPNES